MDRSGLLASLHGGFVLLALATGPGHAQPWVAQGACTGIDFEEVWFTSPQDGWIVGGSGTLVRTAGQGWIPVNLTNHVLHDVTFRDASVGVVVGDNGSIFRTTDGGDSWTPVASGTDAPLRAVAFGAGGKAYAAGLGILLGSTDDAATWSVVEAGDFSYLDLAAQGPNRAWVVGEGGVIRATTTGGASWFWQTSGTANNLEGVFFLTPSEGWVAGPNGTLGYTQDGGATWTSRNSGISVSLTSVHFVDSNQGWAVGELGTIYRTTNGGLDWVAEGSPWGDDLSDVFFVDASHGWAVGTTCRILSRETTVGVAETLPRALLLQHQPNPVRRSATIEYALPRPGFVRLAIYDIQGRRAAVVVDEHKEAGAHRVHWQPEGLAGGLYFYRCDALGSSISRRLVLLP